MTNDWTRRAALGGLLAGAAAPVLAEAPATSVRPVPRPGSIGPRSARAIVAGAKLSGVTSFICVQSDGTVVEAVDQDILLPPASVAKAVTALYAIEMLGPDYRFATALLGTGPVVDGVLQGDLILKGTGDPILDTDALGGLALQLKEAGISGITGSFLVEDQSLPTIDQIDPGQLPWAGYNPTISGLNLNYNRVHFEWRRTGADYTLTMDARARTYQPKVKSSAMRIADESWPTFTHSLGTTQEQWTVARPALGQGGARWLPVRRPGAYAGDVFRTIAGSLGVTLPPAGVETGPVRGVVLANHVSPAVPGLCGGMLKYSTNLTAEVLGLRASQARGQTPTTLASSARQMNAWAAMRFGAPMGLVDHSGLGGASRVSVASLAKMLTGTSQLSAMLKQIPVKNDLGQIVERADHAIRAKTGTLHFVSALAGYITPAAREPLSFAIISSDLPRRAALKGADRERPPGAKEFSKRARTMQQQLISRWAALAQET